MTRWRDEIACLRASLCRDRVMCKANPDCLTRNDDRLFEVVYTILDEPTLRSLVTYTMTRHNRNKHHRNAVLAADVDVAALDPSAPTPMYVMKPRITHADLEENFNSYIKQTPEYAIRNIGTNPLYLIPALFIPNSRNTILDRCKRLLAEKFYIVYSDWLDKTSVVISLLSVATGLATVAHAYLVGAQKMYVFTDPRDAHNAAKKEELDRLNTIWSTWDVLKLVLAGAPSIIQGWRAFKRSSVPARGDERMRVSKFQALTERNRQSGKKNKLGSLKRFFSARGPPALPEGTSALSEFSLCSARQTEEEKLAEEELQRQIGMSLGAPRSPSRRTSI